MSSLSSFSRRQTTWSLLGLGLGLLVGSVGQVTGSPVVPAILNLVQPVGFLWVNALQAMVVPLVLTHMLATIVGSGGARQMTMARLGGKAVALFVVMLIAGGLLTAVVTPPLLSWYQIEPDLLARISDVAVPDSARAAAKQSLSLGDWIPTLLPGNLIEAATNGDLLSLLLFTILFGLAVTTLPEAQRAPLARGAQGLAQAMLVLVRWVLVLTPVGVFSFTLALALETGPTAFSVLGVFIVLQCLLMAIVTLLLYPVSALFGRVSLPAFARAAAPAQVVAMSTRSSIASLPALVQGGREHLALPDAATGFVLPLSSALFKPNRTVSASVKLLFLAHLFSVPLTALDLVAFNAMVILLSFTTVGVPGGGSAFRTLPAYLAMGVPIGGLIILEAADTIPDIFKTVLNVTGQLSAATLLSRSRAEATR